MTVVLVLTSYNSALNIISVLKAAEIISLAKRHKQILAKRNHFISAVALSSGNTATREVFKSHFYILKDSFR